MQFIPQAANQTPFRAPIPVFSNFVRFGFNPEKMEKVLNISTRCAMNCESLKKCCIICISSIKETMLKYSYTFYFEIFLLRRNKISNVSMKRYAEMKSTW